MTEWADWESGDCVALPSEGEDRPGLPQREVLQRVAGAFRRVEIDWTEGERYAEARIAAGIEVGMPKLMQELDVNLFRGRTVRVSVADAPGPDAAWVRFFMCGNTAAFELHYEPPGAVEACRALAHKLAEALGYEFITEVDAPVQDDSPPTNMLMHRDLWPDAQGQLPAKTCPSPEDLVRRVVNRFPLAIVDRDRPAHFGHRHTHITIREVADGPHCRCRFFSSEPPTIILIEYDQPQDRDACRPLLAALVAALADYFHVTQDDDDEVEDPDDSGQG